MFEFDFWLFGKQYAVRSQANGDVGVFSYSVNNTGPFYLSLKEFREIYGSCSVVGCDHLTLGDYLPIA